MAVSWWYASGGVILGGLAAFSWMVWRVLRWMGEIDGG